MKNINYYYDNSTGKWVVELMGEMDIYLAPKFRETINTVIKEKMDDICIDCSGLDYMDSTGLGVLIGALKKVKEGDKNIYLKNLKPSVKKLFNITGLDKIFILEG